MTVDQGRARWAQQHGHEAGDTGDRTTPDVDTGVLAGRLRYAAQQGDDDARRWLADLNHDHPDTA